MPGSKNAHSPRIGRSAHWTHRCAGFLTSPLWAGLVLALWGIGCAALLLVPSNNSPTQPAVWPDTSNTSHYAQILDGFDAQPDDHVAFVITRTDGESLTGPDLENITALHQEARQAHSLIDPSGPPSKLSATGGLAALATVAVDQDRTPTQSAEVVNALRQVANKAAHHQLNVALAGPPVDAANTTTTTEYPFIWWLQWLTIGCLALILLRSPAAAVVIASAVTAVVCAGETLHRAVTLHLPLVTPALTLTVHLTTALLAAGLVTIRYQSRLQLPEHRGHALRAATADVSGAIVALSVIAALPGLAIFLATTPASYGPHLMLSAVLAATPIVTAIGVATAFAVLPASWLRHHKTRVSVWLRSNAAQEAARACRAPARTITAALLVCGLCTIGAFVGKNAIPAEPRAHVPAVLTENFPAGVVHPVRVLVSGESTVDAAAVAMSLPAVYSVEAIGPVGSFMHLAVTLRTPPESAEAEATIRSLSNLFRVVSATKPYLGGVTATLTHNDQAAAAALPKVTLALILLLIVTIAGFFKSVPAALITAGSALLTVLVAYGSGRALTTFFALPPLSDQTITTIFITTMLISSAFSVALLHYAALRPDQQPSTAAVVASTAALSVLTVCVTLAIAVLLALWLVVSEPSRSFSIHLLCALAIDALVIRYIMWPAATGLLHESLWWPRTKH